MSATARTDLADREDVEDLVRAFYRDVATDDVLGPIFARAEVDWPAHIGTLTDFWCGQLFGQRGYEGNPLRAHQPLHRDQPLTAGHFDHWVDLFSATIDERFAGPTADLAKARAKSIAATLRRLLDDEPVDDVVVGGLPRPVRRAGP
jgi:hemoglobin